MSVTNTHFFNQSPKEKCSISVLLGFFCNLTKCTCLAYVGSWSTACLSFITAFIQTSRILFLLLFSWLCCIDKNRNKKSLTFFYSSYKINPINTNTELNGIHIFKSKIILSIYYIDFQWKYTSFPWVKITSLRWFQLVYQINKMHLLEQFLINELCLCWIFISCNIIKRYYCIGRK